MRVKIHLTCFNCQTQCLKPGIFVPDPLDFPSRQSLHVGCTFCRRSLELSKRIVDDWKTFPTVAHTYNNNHLSITVRKDS